MDNTNYEGGITEESGDKKTTLTPEIILGKMKINLDTLPGGEEKLIIESHNITGEFSSIKDIEIDLKKFTGELSGYFEIENTNDDLEIVLIDKDGGEVFKRKITPNNDGSLKIKLIGDPKEYLDIKI